MGRNSNVAEFVADRPYAFKSFGMKYGGESGIRTHVTLSSKHAFQACAFSHSAISPANLGRTIAFLQRYRTGISQIRLFGLIHSMGVKLRAQMYDPSCSQDTLYCFGSSESLRTAEFVGLNGALG